MSTKQKYWEFEKKHLLHTLPILNTTEIGLEIQGEDLELVWQTKNFVKGDWFQLAPGMTPKAIEERPDLYRQVLLFTPKQTPKADSEKKVGSGLDLDKLDKEVDNFIANATAKDYEKLLPKVDNHIGGHKLSIDEAAEISANLYFYDKKVQNVEFEKRVYEAAFKNGVHYSTQHPDPAMVDRILEYIIKNHKGNVFDGTHIKSMRDDILKELSK